MAHGAAKSGGIEVGNVKSNLAVLAWPAMYWRQIGWASLFGVATLLANNLWHPSVEPLYPKELELQAQTELSVSGTAQEDTLDFIFRPLFQSNRRPRETVATEEIDPPELVELAAAKVDALAGYKLLGVFSSDTARGVILTKDSKERMRLYEGEFLHGWQLRGTNLRGASFSDDAGQELMLELAVASSLPIPPAVAPPVAASSANESQTTASSSAEQANSGTQNANANEAAKAVAPTFDAIAAKQRARLAERKRKASGK